MFLLDTSAIIGLMERHDVEIERLLMTAPDVLPMRTVFTEGELRAGLRGAMNDPSVEDDVLDRIRQTVIDAMSLPVVDFDESVVDCYERVSAASPPGVSHNEQWIVASAVAGRLELITQDRKQASLMNDRDLHESLRAVGRRALRAHYVPVGAADDDLPGEVAPDLGDVPWDD